jgi:hypothetical protein
MFGSKVAAGTGFDVDRHELTQNGISRERRMRARVTGGFSRITTFATALGPACGQSAVLGRMPWENRATAIEPDAA